MNHDGLAALSPMSRPDGTAWIPSPYEVNEALLRALPPDQREAAAALARARRFEPLDHRGFKADTSAFGLQVAIWHEGGARVTASAMQRGMAMTVLEPTSTSYTFGVRRRGALSVSGCGRADSGIWGPGMAVLYRERPGVRVATSDGHRGVSFELPYERILELAEALTERPVREFAFSPALDLSREPGASVARAVAWIEQELLTPCSMLSQGKVGPAMQDMLIRLLLASHSHTSSDMLQRPAKAAGSRHIDRAEAFLRAHATEALSVERLAEAAGCSVRSLQAAFRRFRGASPMQLLTEARLDLARNALRTQAERKLSDVARSCGFTNMGRFSQQYGARFGELPSETRRAGRLSADGRATSGPERQA